MPRIAIPAFLIFISACAGPAVVMDDDAGHPTDASRIESDSGPTDAGSDARMVIGIDTGYSPDAGPPDAFVPDVGRDAGSDASGAMGDDAGSDAGLADAGPPDAGRDSTTVVQLALGDTHSCSLRASGNVVCWGNPGRSDGRPVVTGAVEIAASGTYGYARLSDGTVRRWTGTSGPVTVVSDMPPDPPMAPAMYAPGESFPLPTGDYVEIYAGRHHTCGRRMDGSIWCWGQNELSQIGRATDPYLTDTLHTASPPGEVLLAGARMRASTIALGRDHTCAALTDGRVVCWGSDSELQLGRWVDGLESIEPVEPSWY
jgi:hypothetical protein